MTDKPKQPGRKVQRRYKPQEVDLALAALIYCGGNQRAAAEVFEAQTGIKIPYQTIGHWRRVVHTDRYHELLAQHGPDIEQKAVDNIRANMPLLAHGISLSIHKTIEELEDGSTKDPSAAGRNLSVIDGIQTRKLMDLTGRPQVIEHHHSADELIRSLQRALVGGEQAIEGSAVEIPASTSDGADQS